MSKAPSHPIILKKDDSQRSSRSQAHQPIQPKILTKSSKENIPAVVLAQKKIIEVVKEQPALTPSMKTFQRMIYPHFQLDQKILDYLDAENTDFLVVGVVGPKNCGKSTIINMIANPNFLDVCDANSVTFQRDQEVFPTSGVSYEGNCLDFFISTDRIFFIDSSPLLTNVQKRDMIVSECDDIKMLAMLLQLCHLVLVVNDGFPNLSVARLLSFSDLIIPNNNQTHRPTFISVGNRMQPGTKMLHLDLRAHESLNLFIPDLLHPDCSLHHDVNEIIQSLQEKVFMSKRCSMDPSEEVFTEKKWGQRLVAVMDQMKNDYFLRKYESLRDKYHQPIEN